MGIRWTKTREFEVACELFVREGSGPYVPAEQDDLRRACEAAVERLRAVEKEVTRG